MLLTNSMKVTNTIPNSKVINDQITNFAVPDTMVRVKISVSVAYGTDPKIVRFKKEDIRYPLTR